LDRPALARFEALRRWRAKTAEARGVAPDVIFSNDILLAIAQQAPRSQAELQAIVDIGPWKAKTYGPDILQIVNRRN
jgi:ribonuclease D